jgi:hypothetical protein
MIDNLLQYFNFIDKNNFENKFKKQIFSHISSFSYFNDIDQEVISVVNHLIFSEFDTFTNYNNFVFDYDNETLSNLKLLIKIYINFHLLIKEYEENIENFPVDKYGRVIGDIGFQYGLNISNVPHLDIILARIFILSGDVKITKKTKILMTHDIDKIHYLSDFKELIKSLVGDAIKRRIFSLKRVKDFIYSKSAHFDLEWLYRKNQEHIYLFLPKKSYLNADYTFPDDVNNKLIKLNDMGVHFGYHYSFEASNDKFLMENEYKCICEKLGKIYFVRGHYLRRSINSDSFIINNNLIDLTPYPSKGGFLYFSGLPFLLLTKSGLKKILPTHSMDVTFELNRSLTADEKFHSFLMPFNNSIGVSFFVVNWHNTSRRWGTWLYSKFKYEEVCRRLGI